MSNQYAGGFISKTPPTVTTSSAQGMWTLSQQAQYQKEGNWPYGGNSWVSIYYDSINSIAFDSICIDSSYNIYSIDSGGYISVYSPKGVFTNQVQVQGAGSGTLAGNNMSTKNNILYWGVANKVQGFGVIAFNINSASIVWAYSERYSTSPYSGTLCSTVVDSATNIYAAGGMINGSNRWIDTIVKYNSSGARQWIVQYDASASKTGTYPNGLVLDSNDTPYITGTAYVYYRYAYIAKLSSSDGSIVWQRYLQEIGTRNYNGSSAICTDSLGNVYAAGTGNGSFIVKYSSSGVLQWQQRYVGNGGATPFPACMTSDSSNNIYTVYLAYGSPYFFYVTKYNSSGVLQWQRKFYSVKEFTGKAIVYKADMNCIVIGCSMADYAGVQSYSGINVVYKTSGSQLGTYTVGNATFTIEAASGTDSSGTANDVAGGMTNPNLSFQASYNFASQGTISTPSNSSTTISI